MLISPSFLAGSEGSVVGLMTVGVASLSTGGGPQASMDVNNKPTATRVLVFIYYLLIY